MAKKLNRVAAIANPRKKKARGHKGHKRNRAHKTRSAWKRNPGPGAHRKHKASKGHKRSATRKRNPSFDFAGLPIMEVAIGGVAAIVVKALINAIPQLSTITTNKDYGKYVAPVGVAAGGYALYHFSKDAMAKSIGKFACAFGVYLLIEELVSAPIQTQVASLLGPATPPTTGKGAYGVLGGVGARAALGGTYLSFNAAGKPVSQVGGSTGARAALGGHGFLGNLTQVG